MTTATDVNSTTFFEEVFDNLKKPCTMTQDGNKAVFALNNSWHTTITAWVDIFHTRPDSGSTVIAVHYEYVLKQGDECVKEPPVVEIYDADKMVRKIVKRFDSVFANARFKERHGRIGQPEGQFVRYSYKVGRVVS